MRNFLQRIGPLIGFALVVTSCVGAKQAEPLPTPAATETKTSTTVEPEPTETSKSVEVSPVATEIVENEEVAVIEAVPTRFPAEKYDDLEIVTLLPRDAIPAIDNPQFLTVEEADEFYDPDELIMGVTFNGETRAYSVPFLSNHEIVNDTVGGVKIAVTW